MPDWAEDIARARRWRLFERLAFLTAIAIPTTLWLLPEEETTAVLVIAWPEDCGEASGFDGPTYTPTHTPGEWIAQELHHDSETR